MVNEFAEEQKNNFDQFHPLVLVAHYPNFPKFWFGNIIQLNITSDRHCSYGTIMGLDYNCSDDLIVTEKKYPTAQIGSLAYDIITNKDFFWMYKVQSFSFYGWFSEQKLIRWGNKPNLISDYINKIDNNEVFTSIN